MRKYGKYERMPDGTRAKQPAVKSMLLQTYFTSLICLVLCVSMFFGTSYAWFTSEVENTGNEIYIGTLDVGLFKHNGVNAEGETMWADLASSDENTTKLFDSNIRWEPGYTALETVKVTNEGDLAFNYELKFTDGKINGQEDYAALLEVAQNFVVYVHAGEFTDSDPQPSSYADIKTSAKTENGTWRTVRLGDDVATLADILTRGLSVISGSMENVRADVTNPDVTLPGPNDSKPTENTYTIALHMKEDTTAEVMGHKISLNVKLTAYQRTYEGDAFGDQYDDNAKVPTIEPVEEAVSFTAYDIFGDRNGNTEHDITMNIYKFIAADFQDAYPVGEYSDWTCDFYVSTDAGVKDGLILVGNYGTYGWLGFHVPENDEPYPPTGLLGVVTSGGESNWTYEAICNDVAIFSCGIHDSQNRNLGVEVTVELRMTSPDKSETITVARVTVTLPDT